LSFFEGLPFKCPAKICWYEFFFSRREQQYLCRLTGTYSSNASARNAGIKLHKYRKNVGPAVTFGGGEGDLVKQQAHPINIQRV
jgi:hypothetical protein